MLLTDGARPSGACSTRSRVPAVHRRQLDPAVIDLCAHGSLAEVAELASRAVLEALGEHPKAVLLHLSRVTGGPDAAALEVLASGGAEVRAWPGVPIGVVCPDGGLAHRLSEFRDSRHLVIASHRSTVLAQLADGPSLDTVHATVVPAARSTSAMRQLVARTLLDWGCASQIGATTVVVNELVTSAMLQSDGDLQVMVARCGQRLRIEVRDTAGAGRPEAPVRSGREAGECCWSPPWPIPGVCCRRPTRVGSSGPSWHPNRRTAGAGGWPRGRAVRATYSTYRSRAAQGAVATSAP